MIISNISGGLGNQLFQYAAAKALALHHNVDLKLDTSHFEEKSLRKFELEHLSINPLIASAEECYPYKNISTAKKFAQRLLPPHKRKPFKEPGFKYYSSFLEAPANAYLKGNWQSEKYFSTIGNILREEFEISPKLVAHLQAKSSEMQMENSVTARYGRFLLIPLQMP